MKRKELIYFLATALMMLTNVTNGWCSSNATLWLNDLKGPIKECREYLATVNSGKLVKGDLNSVKKYDKEGRLTEWCEYENSQTLLKKNLYKYDNKGNRTEWCIYDNKNVRRSKFTYKYDGNGNAVEELEYNEKDSLIQKFICRYNSKNQLAEKTCYKKHDCKEWKCTYLYNDKGHEMEWHKNDVDSSSHFEKWTKTKYRYKYDKKGNMTERTALGLQDDQSWRYTFEYKKGHVKRMFFYDDNDDLVGRNDYKYDKKGNCSEIYMYLQDSKNLIGGFVFEHQYYK